MAKAIYKRYPKAIVHILEKEKAVGYHTSGRNSGVIHAGILYLLTFLGIYYASDSLKAKFCRQGNQLLTKYCIDNNIPLNNCGKFIVAADEKQYEQLFDIYNQGIKNGINVQLMSREQALKKEPLLRGFGNEVIWSPNTSVANSKQLIKCVSEEIKTKHGDYCTQFYGVELLKMEKITKGDQIELVTKDDLFESRYLINCTGQQSLDVAQKFGFGNLYEALPVKGNYLISNEPMPEVKTLVYPVPLKGTYFLGVHSTITTDGYIKIGPNATPAFSHENYNGFENIKLPQLAHILGLYTRMLFSKQIGLISTLAFQELPKLQKSKMVD